MDLSWIKLWRELLKKPIWKQSTSPQRSILIAVLLMANHEESEWEWQGKKFKVMPGEFVTSLESIRKKAGYGISIQNVRSSLARFKKLEFLTYMSTKSGRKICIINWDTYQPSKEEGQQSTQQRGNKGATTNKNDKNVIKVNTLYENYKIHINPKRKSKERAVKNIKTILLRAEKKVGLEKGFEMLSQAILNYKSVCGDDPGFKKDPANFFGINEPFYVDFLPGKFEPHIDEANKPRSPEFK